MASYFPSPPSHVLGIWREFSACSTLPLELAPVLEPAASVACGGPSGRCGSCLRGSQLPWGKAQRRRTLPCPAAARVPVSRGPLASPSVPRGSWWPSCHTQALWAMALLLRARVCMHTFEECVHVCMYMHV